MTPGFKYAEFNNLKAFEDAITENTIGIMVEPVQGEGGVHPATKEFLTACANCAMKKACSSSWTKYRAAGAAPVLSCPT